MNKICAENCLYRIAMLTIAMAFALTLYIAYLLLWPHNIIEQRSIGVENHIVKPGDNVVLVFSFCKYEQYPSEVDFFLVDNTPFALRTIAGNLPLGCRDDLKYPVLIPSTVTPGEYYIRQRVTYRVNKLREQTYFYDSEHFTVAP